MNKLQEGERVHWTHFKRSAIGGMELSTRKGVVVKDCGSMVIVRYRGNNLSKLRTQLRRECDHTELTDFVKESATDTNITAKEG